MNIVVLDGFTLNPGDLSWKPLEELGKVTMYDRTPSEDIISRAANAEIVIVNKTPLTPETLEKLPKLEYIGLLSTGYNIVDIDVARERGIPVTNIPSYGTMAVAQMVFALLLEQCHHVKEHSDDVKRGKWSAHEDFCFWNFPLIELADKTMGIIGFGRIGHQVGIIASAMGMKVLAYDHHRKTPPTGILDFSWVELQELLEKSDVVSLNCPLLPETEEIMNKETIGYMKKSAILINASRGGLVNDQDLADALNKGNIAGASLDVVGYVEPPNHDNPLINAKNCIITPHIAWAAKEARQRLLNTAVENVHAYLKGRPQNVVNPGA